MHICLPIWKNWKACCRSLSMEKLLFDLIYRLIPGLVAGSMVIRSVKYYQDKSSDYGRLTPQMSAGLLLVSVVAFYIPGMEWVYRVRTVPGTLFTIIPMVYGVWMLVLVSYLDQRSGYIQTLPIYRSMFMSLVSLVILGVTKDIRYGWADLFMVICAHAVCYVLHLFCYTKGDYYIFLAGQYLALLLCKEYFISTVFSMVFLACLFSVIRNLFRVRTLLRQRKDKSLLHIKTPFSMYIALGIWVSLFLFTG